MQSQVFLSLFTIDGEDENNERNGTDVVKCAHDTPTPSCVAVQLDDQWLQEIAIKKNAGSLVPNHFHSRET